ncbi:MAG: chemotaxis protein CheW, partial [Kofleriaceae bacterium]
MTDRLTITADELRRAFDRDFARAAGAPTAGEDVLAIQCGGDPYAIRLAEVAGLHAHLTIEPVPSPVRELTGVAALRGALVPIYDLAALLGYPACNGRWSVVAGGRSMGFAFDRFESHARVPVDAFTAELTDHGRGTGSAGNTAPRAHTRGAVRIHKLSRPLIEL